MTPSGQILFPFGPARHGHAGAQTCKLGFTSFRIAGWTTMISQDDVDVLRVFARLVAVDLEEGGAQAGTLAFLPWQLARSPVRRRSHAATRQRQKLKPHWGMNWLPPATAERERPRQATRARGHGAWGMRQIDQLALHCIAAACFTVADLFCTRQSRTVAN